MGWFSPKKKIYVASTAYNMAGDFALRPNYLKSSVSRGVLTNANSLGDVIIDGQFQGPSMSQRGFFRWARNHYPEGVLTGSILNHDAVTASQAVVTAGVITPPPGEELEIVFAWLDDANITYFAERHILENNPDLYLTAWTSDYDDALDQMKITYADTSVEMVTMTDFDQTKDYLYAYYNTVLDEELGAWSTFETGTDSAVEPDFSGDVPAWVQSSLTPTVVTETLETRTYVNDVYTGSTYRNENVTDHVEISLRNIARPKGKNETRREDQRLTKWKDHTIVTVTTYDYSDPDNTVRTEREDISVNWDYQIEKRDVTLYNTNNRKVYIYELGSGNATLDALRVTTASNMTEFFPVIPLRVSNKSIRHADFDEYFTNIKRAYKRSIGGSIDDILDEIEGNADIGDVDHCYLSFGVEINTKHREGLRYIYELLKLMMASQSATKQDILDWQSSTTYAQYQTLYHDWVIAQEDHFDPLYNTPPPAQISHPLPEMSELRLRHINNNGFDYDAQISWAVIDETVGTGLLTDPLGDDRKPGDLWWEVETSLLDPGYRDNTLTDDYTLPSYFFRNDQLTLGHVKLFWQVDETSYKTLDVYGLEHKNRVYKGKSVDLFAHDEVVSTDTTGFVFPLHYATLQELPLVWANEVAVSNRILIFNSYDVVKQKWYETGLFKIIFAIVIAVVIAIAFPAGIGLLGPYLSVGASFGFAAGTMTALIAGAVANAVAAIILTHILTEGANMLVGEKWGALVAALATMLIGHMAMNYHMTGNFGINWGVMMRADNLLGMTNVIQRGVSGYTAGRMGEINEEYQEGFQDHQDDMENILEQYADLGYSGVLLDPLMFTQQGNSFDGNRSFESSATFLRRTLLTGSDIADLTLAMIDDFSEISLALPEPIE